MAEKDQDFVEYIVKSIVEHPDDVKTKRTIDEMGVLIELEINQEDMGRIIGKEGRTAKAIRTLLRVLGAQANARINLKILEPEGSTRPPRQEFGSEETATAEPIDEAQAAVESAPSEEVPAEEATEEAPAEELNVGTGTSLMDELEDDEKKD